MPTNTTAEDLNGPIRLMMKTTLERMLNTELDVHLGRRAKPAALAEGPETPSSGAPSAATKAGKPNRRNGHSRKTVQGNLGELTIATPLDRDGTFKPLLIPKYQRRVPGFDEKIMALYTKGMTTRNIQDIVRNLYGVEVSPTLISEITSDLDAEVAAWRSRRLAAVWPIVYFDGLVVHVRGANGHVSQHTVYVAIGVNLEGKKELLGLWLAESEGASHHETGDGQPRKTHSFDDCQSRKHLSGLAFVTPGFIAEESYSALDGTSSLIAGHLKPTADRRRNPSVISLSEAGSPP